MFVKHFGFVQATESRIISTQTNIFLFLGKEEIIRECVCVNGCELFCTYLPKVF